MGFHSGLRVKKTGVGPGILKASGSEYLLGECADGAIGVGRLWNIC